MREQGEEKADAVIQQFQKYPIELAEIDKTLAYEAAKLKGKYKIAYADCFAAALARRLNARLVTGDSEFQQLEDRVDIEWIVKL